MLPDKQRQKGQADEYCRVLNRTLNLLVQIDGLNQVDARRMKAVATLQDLDVIRLSTGRGEKWGRSVYR